MQIESFKIMLVRMYLILKFSICNLKFTLLSRSHEYLRDSFLFHLLNLFLYFLKLHEGV
jgi:hypothetical protein